MLYLKLFLFVNLVIFTEVSYSAKILYLVPLCTGSEANFFHPIAKALAERGHELTVFTSKKSKSLDIKNVVQIETLHHTDIFGAYTDPFKMEAAGEDMTFTFLDLGFFSKFCDKVFEHEDFIKHVLSGEKKFDVIFTSMLFHQCFYGLAEKFNTSIILGSSFPAPNYMMRHFGTYLPPSFIPYYSLPLSNQMAFTERVLNFIIDAMLQFWDEFSHVPKFESVYRRYLPNGDKLKSVSEFRKGHVSLVLLNSFFALNFQRPLLPDVVEVGGLHCEKANPLPEDLEKFVSKENAPDGFIYFSLGSIVQGKHIPVKIRNMFIRTFSKLKQKVLWKWEGDEKFPGLPSNVMVSKWFPQKDILGHPNLRTFMTHGGLFSSYESIYNGVPLVGFPIYFDQNTNIKAAVQQGYALELNIYRLQEKELQHALDEILHNPKYKERATYLSSVFKDQMQDPLTRAIYWIEYVIRHNGAPHLRSAARDLYWFQYHSLDVIFCILGVFATVLFVFVCLVRACVSKCCGKKQNSGFSKAARQLDNKKRN